MKVSLITLNLIECTINNIILGQLWKLGNNVLKNKRHSLKLNNNWTIKKVRSSRGNRVYIEDQSQNSFLGIVDNQVAIIDYCRGQSWIKGEENNQGYFTLMKPTSGKALTATSEGYLTIEGKT